MLLLCVCVLQSATCLYSFYGNSHDQIEHTLSDNQESETEDKKEEQKLFEYERIPQSVEVLLVSSHRYEDLMSSRSEQRELTPPPEC